MFDGSYSNGIFARIRGVPDRSWLFFFTCAATVICVQLLYLANDDLFLNLSLSSFAILGFVFSYNLSPGYHRFVIIVLDIAAISIFAYYSTKAWQNYATTWGTDLGVLLGILICLYSFRAFTERDHRMILAASLVILLLASVASYDVKLMFILPFFVFCSFATLYVANNLNLADRISYLASEIGAGASVLHLAGRATAAVFAVSILIYMVVPHSATVRNPQFRLPTTSFVTTNEDMDIPQREREEIDQTNSVSGFSDKFDLSQGGRLNIKDDPILLVRSTLNDYLRGKVFDVYDGMTWTQSELASFKNAPMLKDSDGKTPTGLPLVDFPSRAVAEQLAEKKIFVAEGNTYSSQTTDENTDLKYSVHHLEVSFLKNGLAKFFSPYQPYKVEDISSRTGNEDTPYAEPYLDAFSIVNATRGTIEPEYFPKGFEYKLLILKPGFLPAKLEESPNNVPREIRDHYTQLPPTIKVTDPERDPLVKLALTVASGGNADPDILPYDKVLNIYDYFVSSGEFSYSLDYPEMPTKKASRLDVETGKTVETEVPEVDAAYYFVFQAKKGYCEYFANAFAVFCRINKIPARIVTGYAPGRFDFVRNGYVISTKNAHSWVEVYFDGFGWVAFDPTPASSDFLSSGEIRSFFNATFDFVQNLFVIDPRGVQEAVVAFFGLLFKRLYEVAVENSVTSAFILAGLFSFLFWSIWRRRPRREPPHIPKNEVVAAFYSIEATLALNGLHRPIHQPVRVFLRNTERTLKPLAESLRQFAEAFYRAAYGNATLNQKDIERANEVVSKVSEYFELQKKQQTKKRQDEH